MYWCAELLNQHQQVGSLLITHRVCCMMRTCPAHRCHLPATLSHGKRNKAALRGPFHTGLIPLMTSQNLLTSQRPHPLRLPHPALVEGREGSTHRPHLLRLPPCTSGGEEGEHTQTTPPETPLLALVEGSTHRPHQAKTHHIYWILLIAGWRADLKGGLAEQSTPIKNTTAYQGESSGKELTKLSRKFLKGSGTQIG